MAKLVAILIAFMVTGCAAATGWFVSPWDVAHLGNSNCINRPARPMPWCTAGGIVVFSVKLSAPAEEPWTSTEEPPLPFLPFLKPLEAPPTTNWLHYSLHVEGEEWEGKQVSFSVRLVPGGERFIIWHLPPGDYSFGCWYRNQRNHYWGGPTNIHFTVQPGEVIYVGRLHLEISYPSDNSVTTVEDDHKFTLGLLERTHGAIGTAATRRIANAKVVLMTPSERKIESGPGDCDVS